METKRAKPIFAKPRGNAEAHPVDRISKLPDTIIHRILSLVPTIDVVRMSLLSKRWRRVWCSVPALNFSDADRIKYFPSRGTVDFYSFANNCLKHRKAASRYICDSVVTRFQLDVKCPLGRSTLEKCLAFAVQSNAEEIDVRVKEDMKYILPGTVLNMRSLSVLRVDNVVFKSSYSAISLPALKHLSLIVDELGDELLRDLISGCPSLENFFLQYTKDCFWGRRITITSSTLKFLEIKTSFVKEVHVEAINLVSFNYDGRCYQIDISACTAIRNLSLISDLMGNQSLENLSIGLPVLENLTLGKFRLSKYNRICGQNLKTLRILNPSRCSDVDVLELTVESPNLTSFSYMGHKELRLSSNLPPHGPSSCN